MSDYNTRDFDTFSPPARKDHLFLWTVFILLLMGFAMACWLGSFYIFGHPERAQSYKILQKLHKLDPPKRFELTAAPPGEFLTAQKLFERYNTYPPLKLQAENDELLRMYINNYQSTKKLVPYIVGRFTILDSRELKPMDLFTSGVAAMAQSADYPQVLLEHVYTSDARNVPALMAMLKTGLDVKLARTLDLAAVVHIHRASNGSLEFTAVPLLYGSYALKQGAGTFALEPPPGINVAAGLPIIHEPELGRSLESFAQYQRENSPASTALDQPMSTPAAAASATPATSELVRVDPNPAPEISLPMRNPHAKGHTSPTIPGAAATPAQAIAQASEPPPARRAPTPAPEELAMTAPPHARELRTPIPAPVTSVVAASTPVVNSANGVPLTPFLQSAPAPVIANNGASWRTYAPGQMPRGRVIQPSDAAPLAESGIGGERLDLRGNFVVTASDENRAVLRPQTGALTSLIRPGAGATRVFVQYPAGSQPPAEGSTLARDETRPFLITDVRRGADGQITLYVREITAQ